MRGLNLVKKCLLMAEDVNAGDTSDPNKTVPYSRFKDVNEAKNKAEQELQTLKTTPDQKKEEKAKKFLKGLVKEQLEEEKEAKKASETKEQKEFDSNVDKVITANPKVDKAEFLKFIEDNSDKYTITTVKGAMKLYKDLNQIKDDTVEQTKEDMGKKPKLPKSKGAADTTIDYVETDKDKTYEQVQEEIIKEAEEKGQK